MKTVEVLLSILDSPGLLRVRDKAVQLTPLGLAVANGHSDVMEALVKAHR